MKDGYCIYLIFIQSPDIKGDFEKLDKHSEYRKVGKFCMAYVNDVNKSKSTEEVRDNIVSILGDNALVMVVNAREADAAWYMDAEESKWLKEYL